MRFCALYNCKKTRPIGPDFFFSSIMWLTRKNRRRGKFIQCIQPASRSFFCQSSAIQELMDTRKICQTEFPQICWVLKIWDRCNDFKNIFAEKNCKNKTNLNIEKNGS
jgi:hypothetical protein